MIQSNSPSTLHSHPDSMDTTAVTSTGGSKAVLPEPLSTLQPPVGEFYLDQFKNGISVEQRVINKNRLVFGRAPDCDIQLEHPSISRYHATLLWSPKNDDDYQKGTNTESFWYLIDCGSTHGTVCNKVKVDTGKMIKLRPNNNVFKFGASTRFFILGSQSEEDDAYESDNGESDIAAHRRVDQIGPGDSACSWGIQFAECDEEDEETGDSIALKSIISAMKGGESIESKNHNAYSDSPYRCIQQWFEREGHHFDYKVDSINNKFKCNLELPIDGQWIPIEGALANRKKDAISDACMKCCSILDKAQLLFPWQRQNTNNKNSRKEYYDDEDGADLIDETISGNMKRQKKSHDSEIDNYDTLNAKWKTTNDELCKLKVRLATIGLEPGTKPEVSVDLTDSLDAYLAEMNKKKFGLTLNEKIEKSNLRVKIKQLEQEQSKLEKLIQIAKPVEIKIVSHKKLPLSSSTSTSSNSTNTSNTEANSNGTDTSLQSKESIKEDIKPTDTVEAKPIAAGENQIDTTGGVEPISPHHEAGRMKPPVARAKVSAKQIRKMKQESIIEAIEKEKKLEKRKVHAINSENYVDHCSLDHWLPPVNQTGDGKTHLNDKFGY